MASQEPSFTVPLFINGRERLPPKTFDVVSPVTGETAHRCSAASVDDAVAAVDAAAGAFKTWKQTTPSQRRDILLRAADIIDSRRQELARCLMHETGASQPYADFNINHTTELLKDVAGRIATLEGSFPATMDPESSAIVMREPYGVVLAIAPWYVPSPPHGARQTPAYTPSGMPPSSSAFGPLRSPLPQATPWSSRPRKQRLGVYGPWSRPCMTPGCRTVY